ncbi:hypothetical protein V5O48_012595 [Marasmius crinis-equi]|uniref:Nephrocystin 3-like N-terminal domain-containing protein n=1 Tax=Marasmius crinis-equi TaxID=585013 RepID=A0ABR3F2D3_9AGAR
MVADRETGPTATSSITNTGSGPQSSNNGPGTQNVYQDISHNYSGVAGLFTVLKIPGEGASHRAEGNFQRERALSGTREGVLGMIHDWRKDRNPNVPICWVSGSLGVGKSTIALTVATQCQRDNELITSFLFDTRKRPLHPGKESATSVNPFALVLTIAEDLQQKIPSLRDSIVKAVSNDPDFLSYAPEVQFKVLILEPLLAPEIWSNTNHPDLVIIDGMDEYKDQKIQERILKVILSSYSKHPRFRLRFLICSRPEPWIRNIFDRPAFSQITLKISLDDSKFSPESGIRRYYKHGFRGICDRYKSCSVQFPERWPSKGDFDQLVRGSPTQFLYASDVVAFVGPRDCQSALNNPVKRLPFVTNSIPDLSKINLPAEDRPFHRLDRRYKRVLEVAPRQPSQVLKTFRSVLAAIHFLPRVSDLQPSLALIELLLGLSNEVGIALQATHSILDIRSRTDKIRVYHKSFGDFLSDITRSGEFYIGKEHETLAHKWFQALFVDEAKLYTG